MDLAQFGLVVNPPNEGVEQTVAGLRKIGAAAEDTHKRVEAGSTKSVGAFQRMTAETARTAGATTTLLRTLGPLGGEATEMGVRLERAAVQAERLYVTAGSNVTRQTVLNAAFKEGSIAAATMESAQARLTSARNAAAAVEQAYAKSVAATKIALEEARIAAANVREQRVITSAATSAASGSGVFAVEADRAAREQQNLNRVQGEAVVASNALRSAQSQERAVKQQLADANKDAAASQKLMDDATRASSVGIGASTAIIAGLILILVALAASIYAVKKAWDFTVESLAAAGKVEAAQVSLKNMIGNATEAKKVFEELNQIELKYGVFDEKALLGAATQLWGIGIGLDDLTTKTKQLANVAAILDKPIDASVSAYIRLYETIGSTGKLQARTLQTFAQQGFDVLLVLSQATGKSRDEVARMVKDGEIGIKQIDQALAELAKRDFLGDRAKTWEGIWKRIKAGWEEVHEVFGRPVIDAISPMLERILAALPRMIEAADEYGRRFGALVTALSEISKNDPWGAMVFAFKEAVSEMMRFLLLSFAKTLSAIPGMFKAAFTAAFKTGEGISQLWFLQQAAKSLNIKTGLEGKLVSEVSADLFARHFVDAMLAGNGVITDDLANRSGATGAAFKAAYDKAYNESMFAHVAELVQKSLQAVSLAAGNVGIPAFEVPSDDVRRKSITPLGPGDNSDWDKFKTDLTEVNDMWYQMSILQAKVGDETERNRRINELFAQTAENLYNPAQLEKYVAQLEKEGVVNARLILQEAERIRKQKELDAAIKAGTATIGDSLVSGINKAAKAWGNFDQMAERAATDITDALVNDISSGLVDILTGTKSVSDGFRDMALSIIKDIEAIIVKMLVQYALQQLIGGITGVSGSSGNYSGGGRGYASGGSVTGGSGNRDDVPIMGTAGEFMMSKKAVQNEGIDKMYALLHGKAHIVPHMWEGGSLPPPDIPPDGTGGNDYGQNPPWWNQPPDDSGIGNPPYVPPYIPPRPPPGTDPGPGQDPGGGSPPGTGHSPDYIGYGQSEQSRESARAMQQAQSNPQMGHLRIDRGVNDEERIMNSSQGGIRGQLGIYNQYMWGARRAAHPEWNFYGSASVHDLVNRPPPPPVPHMHAGGIVGVDGFQRMAQGGRVGDRLIMAQDGERVIPRGNGAGSDEVTIVNHIEVNITYTGDGAAQTQGKGADQMGAEELAKALEPVVNKYMLKQKRAGGINAR